ncbi:uncharacterized protein [Ptychodera flava]|uniref:uncharacterized protein isoform X2 n=1 Tax=Ptychodera flava TaxID=63121 RepID=UPI00396A115B
MFCNFVHFHPEVQRLQSRQFHPNPKMASDFKKVFIGRDSELSTMQEKLDSSVQLIQISGMAMVGKTELARQLGESLKRAFQAEDEILHVYEVSLRRIQNIQQVLFHLSVIFDQSNSVISGEGLSKLTLDSKRALVNQSLDSYNNCSESSDRQLSGDTLSKKPSDPFHGHQLTQPQLYSQYAVNMHSLLKTIKNLQEYHLVIFDNAEDMSSDSSRDLQSDFMNLCKDIVVESNFINLVVTTRVKFKFSIAQSLLYSVELKSLTQEDAEELLQLTAEVGIDQEYRKHIAVACGRLPKPLIIAATAIRDGAYTAEQLCAKLGSGGIFEEQTAAVIAASMDKLSGILKEHSAELEYIPGSFGPGLAAAVTGKEKTAYVKQDVLLPMERRSLLDAFVDAMVSSKRYDLHPFIREFIQDHYSHLRDEHLVRDRFCAFFVHLLNEMSGKVDHHARSTLPLVSVELQNIEKFLCEAMHCRPDRYRAIMDAARHGEYILIDFLSTSGCVEFYTACVNSARMNGNNEDCAVMLHCYGQALNQIRGNWREAYDSYMEAIELLKPQGDSERLARLYSSVGWNLHMQGKERKSLRYFNTALEMQERLKMVPHKDTAATLSRLATVYTYIGMFDKAKKYHTESYKMKGDVFGDHPVLGGAQNGLGLYYNQIGDGETAFLHFKRGLATKKRFNKNPTNDVVISLNNVAMEYSKRGDSQKALGMLEEAYQMRKVMGLDHHDTSLIYNNRGKVYARIKDHTNSEECFKSALQIRRRRLKEHASTAGTLQQLGEVLLQANKLQEARETFTEAVEMRKKVLAQQPKNDGIAESLSCLGETCHKLGDKENATAAFEKSIEEYTRVKQLHEKSKEESRALHIHNKINKLLERV